MRPVVLYRDRLTLKEEVTSIKKHFPAFALRTQVQKNDLVIARYSALPYYLELEQDLKNLGAKLINSYSEHQFIASFDYYQYVSEFTPKSWNEHEFFHCDYPGPFVVKGSTNSKKFNWNTMMFAPTKQDALTISSELLKDSMIGQQSIIYRQYVPLKTFEIGLNDLPFTNEWRFFFYKNELLTHAYYWSIADKPELANITKGGIDFAKMIAGIVSEHVNFFVLDIAEKADGEWILIEVNDGQQSGLSENNPDVLYWNLAKALQENQ